MLARSRTSEGWQVEASGLWPIVCLCGEREKNCDVHGPMHMSLHDVAPEEHGKGTRTQSVSYIQHPSHCLNYKMKMQTASGNTRARESQAQPHPHLPLMMDTYPVSPLCPPPAHTDTQALCKSFRLHGMPFTLSFSFTPY